MIITIIIIKRLKVTFLQVMWGAISNLHHIIIMTETLLMVRMTTTDMTMTNIRKKITKTIIRVDR